MKIYFTGSILAGEQYGMNDVYLKIVSILKKNGYEVYTELITDDFHDANLDVLEGNIGKSIPGKGRKAKSGTKKDYYFENLLENITTSHLVVAEISYVNNTLTREISYALELGKPVIALYDKSLVDNVQPLIVGNTADTLFVYGYNQIGSIDYLSGDDKNLTSLKNKKKFDDRADDTLEKVLINAIDETRKNIREKFTMTLPSELMDYLDQISKKKRISRSDFVRGLIEESKGKKVR